MHSNHFWSLHSFPQNLVLSSLAAAKLGTDLTRVLRATGRQTVQNLTLPTQGHRDVKVFASREGLKAKSHKLILVRMPGFAVAMIW